MLAEQFKPLFIKAVEETEFTNFKEDMVNDVLWGICNKFDKDMDFGVYRPEDDYYEDDEPYISNFFAYFSDRSIAIIQVHFIPSVFAEVLTYSPSKTKTDAEIFVEEFRSYKEQTTKAMYELLYIRSAKLFVPNCIHRENEINWRFGDEMAQGFSIFPDGSIAAIERFCNDGWVHNYLK